MPDTLLHRPLVIIRNGDDGIPLGTLIGSISLIHSLLLTRGGALLSSILEEYVMPQQRKKNSANIALDMQSRS